MKLFFHVDLDAFYASVEVLDDPALQGRPVIVGARPGHRGVVSSCSYEARRFGVRSAMPISQAQRRCPDAVFLPVRMRRYLAESEAVMGILGGYTPELQQISIDEAFMDMTGTRRLFGPPQEAGRRVKEDVRRSTGLTLSIGIAPNRYLAKLASERSKPDGLLEVRPGEEVPFLDGLELEDLWGVGARTLARLRELGLGSVGEVRALSEQALCARMGDAGGRYLSRAVRGLDPGIHPGSPKSRSASSEVTFEEDVDSIQVLQRVLLELAQELMQRLIREKLRSDTVVLKLRYFDFTTTTAQRKLGHWIASSEEMLQTALRLLRERWDAATPVRLIGIGAADLVPPGEVQGELFEDSSDKRRKVEEAVTALKESMAGVKITRASLLEGGRSRSGEDPRT
ncbi:MAG: DNA polymerase IV [Spirochaetales bacterium]|nr:DNA polymerase IV [Spirochaetales bacterium]